MMCLGTFKNAQLRITAASYCEHQKAPTFTRLQTQLVYSHNLFCLRQPMAVVRGTLDLFLLDYQRTEKLGLLRRFM